MFMKPFLMQNRKVGSVGGGVFIKSFTSSEQTITQAALLTLAHGLSVEPTLIQAHLVCQTTEFNYSVGDKLMVDFNRNGLNAGNALSITFDATNVSVRYGDGAGGTSVFTSINKTTGASVTLTDGSWTLVIRAWA